jgi:hypothetical protein
MMNYLNFQPKKLLFIYKLNSNKYYLLLTVPTYLSHALGYYTISCYALKSRLTNHNLVVAVDIQAVSSRAERTSCIQKGIQSGRP